MRRGRRSESPPNGGLKLRFTVKVSVLPLIEKDVPTPLTVHWLFDVVAEVGSVMLPPIAVPASFRRYMVLIEGERAR